VESVERMESRVWRGWKVECGEGSYHRVKCTGAAVKCGDMQCNAVEESRGDRVVWSLYLRCGSWRIAARCSAAKGKEGKKKKKLDK
jgi:hypothetical protein